MVNDGFSMGCVVKSGGCNDGFLYGLCVRAVGNDVFLYGLCCEEAVG